MATTEAEAWTDARSAAGRRSPWLIASIISIATFMEVLDSSIANVALNHIAGGLSASYDEATWVLTSYLIANAIAIPISGWLSKIVGRKRFYMLSVALFTGSSLLCGVAPNLTLLILARIAQGIGGGGLAPSEQSILTETFPPAKRGLAFALYGLTIIFGPIIGPTVGGLITDNSSWRWIFLINVPIGLGSLLLVQAFVVDPPLLEDERRRRIRGGVDVDVPGIALLVLWLGAAEFVLDRGQREDWLQSELIVGFLAVSVCSGVALWIWEWRRKSPVFDVKLFTHYSYLINVLVMAATGVVLYGTTQIIPQFLQEVMGYTASDAGEAMTLGGLATLVVLPAVGILSGKFQPKLLLLVGVGTEALALWGFTHIDGEISWWTAAIARLWLAVGIPFLFIPISVSAYADIPPEKIADASAQLNLARNLGGSFGISVAQTLIARRSQAHQARLVEALSPGADGYRVWMHDLTTGFAAQGAGAARAATARMYGLVQRQAQVLGYIDTFWVLALGTAAVMPLILLMKKTDPGAGPAA